MGRLQQALGLGAIALLSACESANVPTAITYKPVYAQVRLLSLLPSSFTAESDAGTSDAGTTDAGVTDAGNGDAGVADAGLDDAGSVADGGLAAFIDVPNDLYTIWDLGNGPGLTAFQQTVVTQCPTDGGDCDDTWTLYVTESEVSIAADEVSEPAVGSFCTYVIAPQAAGTDGGTLAILPAINELPTEPPPSTSAAVELVFGVPSLQDATVEIGTNAVPGPFPPAKELATPLSLSPGNVTVTITPSSGPVLTFANVPLTAGDLTTLALAEDGSGSVELLVITDTFSPMGQATIGQSVQLLSPSSP